MNATTPREQYGREVQGGSSSPSDSCAPRGWVHCPATCGRPWIRVGLGVWMNGYVNVYLRDEQVIVVPCGGRGGLYYEVVPVLTTQPEADSVESAILEALDASARTAGQPDPDLRSYRTPVLAHLGVKSIRKFYRNIALCTVYRESGRDAVVLQPKRPPKDNRGFERNGPPRELPGDVSLGAFLLRILEESPRLNPQG